jgi:hypothetical protein
MLIIVDTYLLKSININLFYVILSGMPCKGILYSNMPQILKVKTSYN